MPNEITTISDADEVTLLSLAREIAMDIRDIDEILKSHEISRNDFETIAKLPRFQALLAEAAQSWSAAENVEKRLKLKMSCMLEESLPELFARLHEAGGLTPAKVKLVEVLMRGAGVGVTDVGNGAEKVSITINMGAEKVSVEAVSTPSKTISAEYEEL